MLLLEAPCCLLENDPILLLRWICQSSNDTWTSATLQYLCPAIKTDEHQNPRILQLCVDAVQSRFTENNLEMRVPGIYW